MNPSRPLILMLLLGLALPYAVADTLKPGLWENRVQFTAGGQSMPENVVKQCMKPADLADMSWVTQADKEQAKNCKMSNQKTIGRKTSWDMVCTGEDAGRGHAEFEMQGESYTGTYAATVDGEGSMTMHYSGRRLGACP